MCLVAPHLGFWELPPRCHVLDHPCLCWALVLWVCQWISLHFFPVGSLLNPVGFVYELCLVPLPLEFSSRELEENSSSELPVCGCGQTQSLEGLEAMWGMQEDKVRL